MLPLSWDLVRKQIISWGSREGFLEEMIFELRPEGISKLPRGKGKREQVRLEWAASYRTLGAVSGLRAKEVLNSVGTERLKQVQRHNPGAAISRHVSPQHWSHLQPGLSTESGIRAHSSVSPLVCKELKAGTRKFFSVASAPGQLRTQ